MVVVRTCAAELQLNVLPLKFSLDSTYYLSTSRSDVCQCLVLRSHIANILRNRPITSMTHVACESKLRSVERSSMHPCPGNWVAIVRAVVHSTLAAHALSAGKKYLRCTSLSHSSISHQILTFVFENIKTQYIHIFLINDVFS